MINWEFYKNSAIKRYFELSKDPLFEQEVSLRLGLYNNIRTSHWS